MRKGMTTAKLKAHFELNLVSFTILRTRMSNALGSTLVTSSANSVFFSATIIVSDTIVYTISIKQI